jgi:hypothetical protein
MTLLVISGIASAAVVAAIYFLSYGAVVLYEQVQRAYRRRKALEPFTRRLHELLADAGHPPVVRGSGGRHRMRAATKAREKRRRRANRLGYQPNYRFSR